MVLLLTLLTAATAWAQTTESVNYIDENGATQTVTATVLTGSETSINSGWYVVKSDISYTSALNVAALADVCLILCDGKTMNIGSSNSPVSGNEGYAFGNSSAGTKITIYGQANGTGALNAYNSGDYGIRIGSDYKQYGCRVTASSSYKCLKAGSVTITRGTLSATSTGDLLSSYSIYVNNDINLNGGNVTANGNICSDYGTTNLGGSTVKASSYSHNVTVALPDGYAYSDGNGNTYANGTLTSEQKTAIAGKTLTVAPDPAHFSVNAAGTEYTIHTATGWGVFCDMLADNDKGVFDGKTVKLGADITVTRMAGGAYHDFTGTFDGDGHTLTLSLGTAESPIDAQYVAPFPNTTDNGNSHPTFRNLTIDGSIYEAYSGTDEHHHVGGLIGHLYGTVTIEHCTSRVNITSTGGAGGFVGLCETAVSFTDCVSSAVIHSAGGNNSGFVGWSRSSSYVIDFKGCLFNGKLLQVGDNGSYNGGFVGWKGDLKTVNITNCLVAPAALADGETMADEGSATFSREHADHAATITNSYYTRTLGTAQGKAPRTVTAGDNVTVAVSPVGQPVANGTYSVSGITAYTEGITRTVGGATTFYYGQDDEVSLTLSNTPPSTLHTFSHYTVSPDGATLSGTENPYTLTMPDADVTIGAEWTLQLVTYLDADGKEKQCTSYTVLTGGGATTLAAGWYVATGTVSYTGTVRLDGDVHLILADGGQMNIGTSESPIINNSIVAQGIYYNPDKQAKLAIYGQPAGTGILSVYTSGEYTEGIRTYAITINGGHIIVNADGEESCAIVAYGNNANGSDVIINGGTVEATATSSGICSSLGYVTIKGGNVEASSIYAHSTITLGWTNDTDRIKINSYRTDKDIVVASGKALTDEDGNILTGTVTAANVNGKTLRPVKTAALASATIFGESKYVGSFFSSTQNFQLPEGALAYTASWDESNEKVVFHRIGEDSRVIPKNTAVIIVSDNESITFTSLSSTTVTPHAGNILQGSDVAIDKPASGTVYVLNIENNTLGFYQFNGDKIPAGKAYYVKQ